MMQVLLVVHLLVVLALIGVVLMQRSEGGALGIGGGSGGGGGMGGLMSGRGTANFLTRTTALLAAAFMVTSILLTILASGTTQQRSIVDTPLIPSAPAPIESQPSGDGQPEAPAVPVQ
ncbi:preprotein translocase subunit SecG [Aquibaculum sediminis]|uniref:preprotein translocase subunit SecG n=1 Tax=Aquibaculum sediminis TaxID=3231907 RepID=UPI0034573424